MRDAVRYGFPVKFIIVVILLILWGNPSESRADVYVYVSKDGVRHFSNTPTNPEYRIFIRSKPLSSADLFLPDRYDHLIFRASKDQDISFSLLKAMIKVESNFNRKAVSRKGALGLMQIMPENLGDFDVEDPFDPWQNIKGGSRYLKALLDRFDGEISLALAAYNAGPTRVEVHGGIPPIRETQNYVKQVLRYAELIHEDD